MSLESIVTFVAITLPAFLVVGYALFDVITTKRLSVAKKVLWVAVIIVTIHIGVLFYLLFRPLPDRRQASQQGGSERSAEFLDLLERHDRDQVPDYTAQKQALFADTSTT